MPTYGYRCGTCRNEFERVQRMSDASLTECPECGGAVRRVVHPVGVVFKGSGWYVTDSRKPAPSENGSGDKTTNKVDSDKTKEPVTAKSEDKSSNGVSSGNGKEPASTTAKTAKTPTKAAAD